ncbi:YifB family Mg chelatase-like AAA ATPase [Candidatus Parcubacteria bacterium]|nr:YifB family Mg chelatase-like AAA ATPase [Candidatus Parcubacteria bacterium]
MLAKVLSGALVGLEAVPVEVEVNIEKQGFPAFSIVGLPDKAVEESKERVRSAIKNSGGDFPQYRITVNLAPADLPKQGPSYDLPIALGILLASDQLRADLSKALVVGELSLDGSVRKVGGVLPLTFLAKRLGLGEIFLPEPNAQEAAIVPGVRVVPVPDFKRFFLHLKRFEELAPQPFTDFKELLKGEQVAEFDFAEIHGQEQARRALEVAAAGGHNLSLKGPPGAGKTMLARALPSIMPRLTVDEALEVTRIYSVTGRLPTEFPLITKRPFRSPHHTTSRIGLIGGGAHPSPGEISLAHRGVLFLDEFPELPRHVIEAIRQPLEDGRVTISRAVGSLTFPSSFMLVVASNPCPCGYLGDLRRQCVCTPSQIIRYQKRVSGPIWDRIDLHVEVPAVKVAKLTGDDPTGAESSAVIRRRVQAAREIQLQRFAEMNLVCNANMKNREVKAFCSLSSECLNLLRQAVSQLGLSARSYFKVIKVARTVADLMGEEAIAVPHLAEALQYRQKID